MLVFSAPVSKKHKRCSLKGRVSLCGQRGITLSALQAVPMHESVLVHESLSPWVCVFECTPAIFQLSFIFPCWECLFPSKRVLTCRGSVKEMVLCYTIEEEWVCVSVYVCICLHVWDADYFWQGDTPFCAIFKSVHVIPQQFSRWIFLIIKNEHRWKTWITLLHQIILINFIHYGD